jgi:hypothetical protein
VTCKTRVTYFVCCRSTYSRTGRYYPSVNTQRNRTADVCRGLEPNRRPPKFSKSQNSAQPFCAQPLNGGTFFFWPFFFLLFFFFSFYVIISPLFLLIVFFFSSYPVPHFYLPISFTSSCRHPTLFLLHLFLLSLLKCCTSSAVILFVVRTIQSVPA